MSQQFVFSIREVPKILFLVQLCCCSYPLYLIHLPTYENSNFISGSRTTTTFSASCPNRIKFQIALSVLLTNYNNPHCCLVMQKDLELLRHVMTLENNELAEPFTLYLTNKKNKQLNKINSYNTLSKVEPKGD